LDAARRVQAAGYKLGFHLILLLNIPIGKKLSELIAQVFTAIDPQCVAWLSLGSLGSASIARDLSAVDFHRPGCCLANTYCALTVNGARFKRYASKCIAL